MKQFYKQKLKDFLKVLVALVPLTLVSSVTAQNYNTTLPEVCSTITGDSISITFPSTPSAVASDGILTITYKGDLDLTSEFLEIIGEGAVILGQTAPAPDQCTSYGTFTYLIPGSTLSTWASSGNSVTIGIDASSSVSTQSTSCPAFCVMGTLSYLVQNGTDNAGALSVDSPTVFCAGVENVYATIANMGTNNINTVDVNWSVNGVTQSPVTYSSTLTPYGGGSQSAQVNLGTYNFTGNSTVKVWTSSPNGVSDSDPANDTVTAIVSPALAGVYTIGGIAPDYPDFVSAENALSAFGVCGPVTFHVREGTYNQQVAFDNYAGVSSLNTITFRPDPANTNPVVLTYTPTTSGDNYTVLFENGAQYITLKSLDITTSSIATYGTVLLFSQSTFITVDSCNIIGALASSTSSNLAVIHNQSSASNIAENITISNNLVQNGSYSIYWYGISTSNKENNNVIVNNDLIDWYNRGIYSYYQHNIQISHNTLKNNNQYTSPTGIYAYYSTESTFSHNDFEISGTSGPQGIYFSASDGVAGNPTKVFNNMITLSGGTAASEALYVTGTSDIHFANNSVNVIAGNTPYPFYITGSTGDVITLTNNALVNNAGGYAYYVASSLPTVVSDYNNLYTTGSNLAYYSGSVYTSVAAITVGEGNEANSVSTNPDFYGPNNLHSFSLAMNGAGTPVTFVTDDIDGDARAATPDIGADEYVILALDAGVFAVDTPSTTSCTPGAVWATVKNFGTSTLTSVTLNWSVNGTAQTPATISINLPSGADTMVFIGNTSLVHGDSVFVSSSNPNGTAENPGGSGNDQSFSVVNTGMSGTYAIGGPGADYYSYNAAVSDIISRGICGDVLFQVNDSTYNEQIIIPVIPNVSPVNTVTFESASGDSTQSIITFASTGSANNFVVRLDGASYVTFRNLTIENTGSSYGRVVEVMNGSNYNTFENNILVYNGGGTSSNAAVIYSSSSGSSRGNQFLGNLVEKGYYGAYYYGNSAADPGNVNVFANNTFSNQYYYGVYLYYQDSLQFRNNVVNTGSNTNTINYGIRGGYLTDFEIVGNDVNDSISYGYGLYLNNSQGVGTNKGIVANNMISKGHASISSYMYGMYFSSVGNTKVAHNSVNVDGSYASNTAIYVTSGGQMEVLNNSFRTAGNGYTVYYNTSYSIERSDYNNISLGGAGFFVVSDGWGYPTLAVWQNNIGKDLNSKSVNPMYLSHTDLHTCVAALDAAAEPGHAMVDFDGEGRYSQPDIGADEFLGANFTLGPDTSFCAGGSVVLGYPSTYGGLFTWSTGDTTSSIVATQPGNYTVIVTGACGGNTDNILVTVDNGPTPSFTYNTSYLSVSFTNTTVNGTTYTWDFGDGTTSSATNPVKVFSNSGVHNVTLYATNDCGTDSVMMTINLQISAMEEQDGGSFSIYPNPATDVFRIASTGTEGPAVLRIFSIQGQLIHSENINLKDGMVNEIDGSGFAKGVYTVILENGSGKITRKLVIQ